MGQGLAKPPRYVWLTTVLVALVATVFATGTAACSKVRRAPLATRSEGPGEMTFFVTSTGVGGGANLGGLEGADRHCRSLAERVGKGAHTWRAYLSAAPVGSTPAVNARDRIGRGPWVNAAGVVVARDVDDLHADTNGLDRRTALTERGETVDGDRHDMLTGSDAQGRLAFTDGVPATCGNWTASGDGVARIGHHDRLDSRSWGNRRFPRWSGSWNAMHDTIGCDAKRLSDTGGGGLFYCFAAEERAPLGARAPASTGATFAHGLNVNHWLGDNLAPEVLPHALYGEDWFDEEDVAWIAAQGFDHLRIRVAGHEWIDEGGDLVGARVARFDDALRWARRHRLGVVLSMHSFPGVRAYVRGGPPPTDAASPFADEATRGDAAYLWWLVARRYAAEGDDLRFEIMNAPDAEDAASMRTFNREALRAIRATSPRRIVYATSHDMGLDSADEVDLDDPAVALAVEMWEPEVFAFQADERLPRVTFPGVVPDLRRFVDAGADAGSAGFRLDDGKLLHASGATLDVPLLDARIDAFARGVRAKVGDREIYVASFGVYRTADDASARAYVRAARAAFERNDLAWAVYDYHTGSAVRAADGAPTRILEALALEKRRE
jgi:Cellulase (glycosyl hydrolase family 5)